MAAAQLACVASASVVPAGSWAHSNSSVCLRQPHDTISAVHTSRPLSAQMWGAQGGDSLVCVTTVCYVVRANCRVTPRQSVMGGRQRRCGHAVQCVFHTCRYICIFTAMRCHLPCRVLRQAPSKKVSCKRMLIHFVLHKHCMLCCRRRCSWRWRDPTCDRCKSHTFSYLMLRTAYLPQAA
jgi:hypothetical protein